MKLLKAAILAFMIMLFMGANTASINLTLTVQPLAHTVSLSWAESSTVAMFYIYRSTVPGGPYSNIASSGTTVYVDGTVSSGTTYYYVVTAVDASNDESAYSNQATAVVPAP